jgi:hypothetical protein
MTLRIWLLLLAGSGIAPVGAQGGERETLQILSHGAVIRAWTTAGAGDEERLVVAGEIMRDSAEAEAAPDEPSLAVACWRVRDAAAAWTPIPSEVHERVVGLYAASVPDTWRMVTHLRHDDGGAATDPRTIVRELRMEDGAIVRDAATVSVAGECGFAAAHSDGLVLFVIDHAVQPSAGRLLLLPFVGGALGPPVETMTLRGEVVRVAGAVKWDEVLLAISFQGSIREGAGAFSVASAGLEDGLLAYWSPAAGVALLGTLAGGGSDVVDHVLWPQPGEVFVAGATASEELVFAGRRVRDLTPRGDGEASSIGNLAFVARLPITSPGDGDASMTRIGGWFANHAGALVLDERLHVFGVSQNLDARIATSLAEDPPHGGNSGWRVDLDRETLAWLDSAAFGRGHVWEFATAIELAGRAHCAGFGDLRGDEPLAGRIRTIELVYEPRAEVEASRQFVWPLR